MRLSVFVSALGWVSIFGVSWLWILGRLEMRGWHIVLYILFWFIALFAGVWSTYDKKNPGG